jgi:hypothetical protein
MSIGLLLLGLLVIGAIVYGLFYLVKTVGWLDLLSFTFIGFSLFVLGCFTILVLGGPKHG